jgi:dihydrofolate reductase
MTLSLIAAIDRNNALGYNQLLLCHLPNDLKRFKQLTLGHTLLMGRKTFQSLPNGALPHRTNVVISSQPNFPCPQCLLFPSWEAALQALSPPPSHLFVIGGASLYQQALPQAHFLYLTRIHHTFPHADTFFPHFNPDDWIETERLPHPADPAHPFPYTFLTYRRRNL